MSALLQNNLSINNLSLMSALSLKPKHAHLAFTRTHRRV
jgi:hypothetical protein